MKIALCFSGQPRFVPEVYEYINNNVIGSNDVDVFAHLWFDEDLQTKPYKYGGNGDWIRQRIPENAIETFTTLYNPKLIQTEKSKSFKKSLVRFEESLNRYWPGAINNPLEPNYRERTINNCLSYFYSLQEVNKLKKLYEYENDFTYDCVIRCRTDSLVLTPIDYTQYDLNSVNFSNINNQPDGMICDWFNFGNSQIMDAFMSVFSVWELVYNKTIQENQFAWCHELLHRKMVDFFNIPISGTPIPIVLPRF
jgi:hypothetical protein